MNKNLKWISFVNKRFSMVDRHGSSSITTRLSILGICFGVMTLITVLSVMNGFQMQFIDSIIELSSYHIQVTDVDESKIEKVEDYLLHDKNVVSFVRFKEAQSLMTDKNGKEAGALIRAVPENVCEIDKGFDKEMNVSTGDFDLSGENGIILGSRLARSLGVRKGSSVNLFALSGGSDTALISNDRTFSVKGIFTSGYAEINSTYAFISYSDAEKYFGNVPDVYGIKLKNQNMDKSFEKGFSKEFPELTVSAWRDYNRSFYGALRIEKNMLLLLVIMIFIVVAINIYNSMRKLVYERKQEISTLASLGGTKKSIRMVFVLRGLLMGVKGAVPGLVLGLLLSFNIRSIFIAISKVQFFFNSIYLSLVNPSLKAMLRENAMWYIYANIPARVMPGEVIFITLFGIVSCVFASFVASSNILKMQIAEVLHDE